MLLEENKISEFYLILQNMIVEFRGNENFQLTALTIIITKSAVKVETIINTNFVTRVLYVKSIFALLKHIGRNRFQK